MDLATGLMMTFAMVGFGAAAMVGGVIWLIKTGRVSVHSDPEAALGAATTVDINSIEPELASIKAELETIKFLLFVAIVAVVFLLFKNHF